MKEVVIDIHIIIEYFGDVTVSLLKEVIHTFHNNNETVVGFTFDDKTYTDTLDSTLNEIVNHWEKWWTINYGQRQQF